MTIRLLQQRSGLRTATGLLASLGACGLLVLLPATNAHAEDNRTLALPRGTYTAVPDSDSGTFRLEREGQCLDVDSSGNTTDSSCDSGTRWNMQPNKDGDGRYLRHVGDNKCMSKLSLAVTDCDSDSVDNFRGVSDIPVDLKLSRQAAISLGENKISICNQGGFAARAVIEYRVQSDPNSANETSDRRVIGSFPAGQCRTETLPAGKIYGNVELRRYTGWYLGNYAFWDGDSGAYAGSANDQLTANWTFGGDHIDGSYNLTGSTCHSGSNFDPNSSNQASSKMKDGQTGCTGVNPERITTDSVGAIVGQVIPMVLRMVFS
ncbi:hypothetical protein ABT112_21490 [Streptomyces sp. NPDC002055]|uniref:hypothetical protein n=1 Tax=Streptomyces sp. NPDC002055 TaxID=3154534 RepID=UPI00332B45B4